MTNGDVWLRDLRKTLGAHTIGNGRPDGVKFEALPEARIKKERRVGRRHIRLAEFSRPGCGYRKGRRGVGARACSRQGNQAR